MLFIKLVMHYNEKKNKKINKKYHKSFVNEIYK